jgi:hypothetical protein
VLQDDLTLAVLQMVSTPRRSDSIPADEESSVHRLAAGREASMQLNYITERILALWLPAEGATEARLGMTRAAALLRNKHGDHYMVKFHFELKTKSILCRKL